MFGEYGMYLDGKIFALICNDQLYIKTTEAGKRLMPELEMAPPYQGAKNYFLFEEIDNIIMKKHGQPWSLWTNL